MPLGFARGRLARRVKRTDVTRDSSSRAVFRSTAPRTPPAPPTNSEECGKKPPQEETGDEAKTKAKQGLAHSHPSGVGNFILLLYCSKFSLPRYVKGRRRFFCPCSLGIILTPIERPLVRGWTRHGEEGEAGGVGPNWAAGCPEDEADRRVGQESQAGRFEAACEARGCGGGEGT